MRIGLIGCGKAGITLGYLIKEKNEIIGVYDINKKHERKAIKILRIKKNSSYPQLIVKSEALFFTTPDDEVLKAFNKAKKFIKDKKYIFHFSGLLTAEIFPKIKDICRGSVHPFATLPKLIIPPSRKKYFLFVQGDDEALKIANRIFPKAHFIIKNIKKEDKKLYHLLGVFSSNLLLGFTGVIFELLQKLNWQKKSFYNIVLPMMRETLLNINRYGIKQALSGPLKRGDIATIKEHLKTLKKNKKFLNTYKTLSLNILEYAPKGKKRKAIKKLLL